MNLKNKLIFIIILISIIGGIIGKLSISGTEASEIKKSRIAIVEAIKPELGSFKQINEVGGNLIYYKKAAVTTSMPNKINKIYVENGSYVRKGTLLLILDTEDLQSKLSVYKAKKNICQLNIEKTRIELSDRKEQILKQINTIQKIKSQTDFAEESFNREKKKFLSMKKLFEKKALSGAEFKSAEDNYLRSRNELILKKKELEISLVGYEQYDFSKKNIKEIIHKKTASERNSIKSAEAELRSINNEIAIIKRSISNCYIKSPLSGYVSGLNLFEGETPDAGKPILTVINSDKLEVVINIPVKYISSIKKGNTIFFRTDIFPEKKFKAKVKNINQIADPQTRSIEIKALYNNKNKSLKPGMFVKTEIVTSVYDNYYSVPEEAVSELDNKFYCFVIIKNVLHKRNIEDPILLSGKYIFKSKVEFKYPVALSKGGILSENLKVRVYDKK